MNSLVLLSRVPKMLPHGLPFPEILIAVEILELRSKFPAERCRTNDGPFLIAGGNQAGWCRRSRIPVVK